MTHLILALALFVSGCGIVDREIAKITGTASEVCMHGVVYYQFSSGSSVAFNQDGTLRSCK